MQGDGEEEQQRGRKCRAQQGGSGGGWGRGGHQTSRGRDATGCRTQIPAIYPGGGIYSEGSGAFVRTTIRVTPGNTQHSVTGRILAAVIRMTKSITEPPLDFLMFSAL
ncbi:hypothetical protein GCM10010211_73200 [Streptomyces albospinus]|uniref:Uncharacterized protein n=1 Tax=Streptomyces albospinus TaxID=285515 RepID=A0ABQ2VL04_9ACTN|nr:hypothetical protein GCM10010211_73200 [Streptomyces albospinus]